MNGAGSGEDHAARSARNGFAGYAPDRAAHLRRDPEALARLAACPEARLALMVGDLHPARAGRPAEVLWLSPGALGARLELRQAVFLGLDGEHPCFALAVEPGEQAGLLPAGCELVGLRRLAPLLDPREAALLAAARAMTGWHRRHRHCGVCGAPTEPADGGFERRCSGCGERHFPRTDPAIIVLVSHGPPGGQAERCLLGRQAAWPARLYSTLAGFVEPGESLEQALAREVAEESGVRVGARTYRSSQPWPFPGSLMLGFQARAEATAIALDHHELEDARWFTRAELGAGLTAGTLALPSSISIAWRLIEEWYDAAGGTPLAAQVATAG